MSDQIFIEYMSCATGGYEIFLKDTAENKDTTFVIAQTGAPYFKLEDHCHVSHFSKNVEIKVNVTNQIYFIERL